MLRILVVYFPNSNEIKNRQVVILDKESIKAQTKTMNEFASKLSNENLKGMERRGTLLSYYAETGKIKLKAIK